MRRRRGQVEGDPPKAEGDGGPDVEAATDESDELENIGMNAYRKQRNYLMSNPAKLSAYRSKDRERAKRYRERMSPAQKVKYNEASRLRMTAYRERKKALPKQKLTASQKAKLRAKWSREKQRQSKTTEEKNKEKRRVLQRQINLLTANEFKELISQTTPRKKALLESDMARDPNHFGLVLPLQRDR
jgi:hypothetical protein